MKKQLMKQWRSLKEQEQQLVMVAGGNTNLSQVINSTRGRYKINISKMQPSSDSLRLTLDSVEFNQLIEWLDELVNQHGLKIENLDLSRDDKSGYVRVSRLVLEN